MPVGPNWMKPPLTGLKRENHGRRRLPGLEYVPRELADLARFHGRVLLKEHVTV